jgi:hypothetical protein
MIGIIKINPGEGPGVASPSRKRISNEKMKNELV